LEQANAAVQKAHIVWSAFGLGVRTAGLRIELAEAYFAFDQRADAERLWREVLDDTCTSLAVAVSLTSANSISRSGYLAARRLAFSFAQRGDPKNALFVLEEIIAPAVVSLSTLDQATAERTTAQQVQLEALESERRGLYAAIEVRGGGYSISDMEYRVERLAAIEQHLRQQLGARGGEDFEHRSMHLAEAVPRGGVLLIPISGTRGGVCVCVTRGSDGNVQLAVLDCPEFNDKSLMRALADSPSWAQRFGQAAQLAPGDVKLAARDCRNGWERRLGADCISI